MTRKHFFLAGTAALALTCLASDFAHADPRSAESEYGTHRSTTSTSYERSSTRTNYNRDTGNDVRTDPGFYLGAYGGYGWSDLDTDGAGGDFDVNGWDYGLFTGFELDALMSHMNADIGLRGAIEAFYGWSGADDDEAGIDAEKDHEWGVSFRPGLAFIDKYSPFGAKPYGIIGYRRANYEFSPGNDEGYDGFELGIGTELVAYDNFGVRLDYSHVWYGEKDGVDPDENDLRLGVAYHF